MAAVNELDATDHKRNTLLTSTMMANNNDEEEVPRTISYGSTSNGNNGESSAFLPKSSSIDEADNRSELNYSTSPINSPAPSRRPPSASILSMFSVDRNRDMNETVLLAPDDLGINLPPNTEMLGSSLAAYKAMMASQRHVVSNYSNNNGTDNASCSTLDTQRTHRTLKDIQEKVLQKVRKSFIEDAMDFAEGTIPQSIVVALVVGVVCGFVAYAYYYALDYFLELVWQELPHLTGFKSAVPQNLHFLWIPIVTVTMSICCGLSVYYLGEPGDLAYTIQCIHERGYKGTHHILPMIAASQFTILAGASLGPEAPLVAICAATAGFISRIVFGQTNVNVIRKHTFMGMSGALSAFFGVPLGGSLFALEVASRFGVEYFEHLVESIFAGEICVVVFRSLAGLPLGQIWNISEESHFTETRPYMIVLGAAVGLLGAGLALLWANFHWRLMDVFRGLGLLDEENARAVPRVLLGACGVVVLGVLVPQTMFWGEFEVQNIASLSPSAELPHVWPTNGLIGFELTSWQMCVIAGFAKLVAISFTVAGGYRGGFIFPFFAAGACFGRAICFIFPSVNPILATLCCAAGINVAITRTSLATPLILAFLAGEQYALPAILAASIVSLFATGYVPFIKSQLARSDIDFSLYYRRNRRPKIFHPPVPESVGTKPVSMDTSDSTNVLGDTLNV